MLDFVELPTPKATFFDQSLQANIELGKLSLMIMVLVIIIIIIIIIISGGIILLFD